MSTNENIRKRVADLERRFAEVADDSEDFDQDLAEVPDLDLAAYLDLLERRGRTPYGRLFGELRDLVVPTLLDSYLGMTEGQRLALLDLLGAQGATLIALWSLLEEYRWRLEKSPPPDKPVILRTLLLIAVLAEPYLDEVETAHILTGAWLDAAGAGLNPAGYFAAAAAVAGQRPLTHGQTARQVLLGFEPYVYGAPASQTSYD